MTQHDQDQFELDIRAVKRAEGDLCISKNRDYGPFNIARAPGGPIMGLAVRLHDKIARLAHLLETGADPEHESVKDTFQDIANYGSIGTMIVEGLWPGVDDTSAVDTTEDTDEGTVDYLSGQLTALHELSALTSFKVGDRVRSYVPGYGGEGTVTSTRAVGDFDLTVQIDGRGPLNINFKTSELELL